MNYEEIQQVRRDIIAGLYTAPKPYACVLPEPQRRKRIASEVPLLEDGWDEGAFQDDFYDEGPECDVAPGYFDSCKLLDTTFFRSDDMDATESNSPLFRGSIYSAKDLARFLLSFKARHLKVGDGILANIVAMMATFLPVDNLFKKWLPDNTSTYLLLKTLDNMAAFTTNLRCLKIDCCVRKCVGFYGDNADLNFCSICGACRWKLCTPACYTEDAKTCDHLQTPQQTVYYNVIQDRLVKLLKSDLKNMFNYQQNRAGAAICRQVVMSAVCM